MSRRVRLPLLSVLLVTAFSVGTRAQVPGTSQTPLSLTLEDAVARGLRENVNARLGEAEVTSARGERWSALQDLLPTASARLGLTRQEINLRVPDQMMGKYPSGGARAGHASLMRPNRPLPTSPFA